MGNPPQDANVFSHGEPKTRVVVYLTDDIENISALAIQRCLHQAGYHVRNVQASRNCDSQSSAPRVR